MKINQLDILEAKIYYDFINCAKRTLNCKEDIYYVVFIFYPIHIRE